MILANLFLYAVIIPVVVYVVVRMVDDRFKVNGNRWVLLAACSVLSVAVFVPSPLIDGQETQFITHVLGGISVGLMWQYFRPLTRKLTWYMEVIYLFALVSALGTLNELYELFAFVMHFSYLPLSDTSWDLLANTLGVSLYYGAYQITKALRRLLFSR